MIESEEVWVPVIGYTGIYECSSLGRIRSVDRYVNAKDGSKAMRKGQLRTFKTSPDGYLQIALCRSRNTKWCGVNRVIYQSFNGPTSLAIDHINNIKTDNRIDNLQAISTRENNIKSKLRHKKTSKYVGVHRCGLKWRAQIGKGKIKFGLGLYDTEEEAHNAYQKQAKILFP